MNRQDTQRLTIAVPAAVLAQLKTAADDEGRSLSNLCCRLLMLALKARHGEPQ